MAVDLQLRVKDEKAAEALRQFARKAGIEFNQLEKKTVASSKKMSAAFTDLKGIAGQLGLAFGAVGLVRGVGELISAASDMTESMNKVKEVFEDSADSIIDFSKRGAEALGASQQQTLAMTGEIGNLLVAMGSTSEEAAGMSRRVVQLAADLGSFNNVPTAEALNAIRAALVGETEPIRRFGSDVRVTRLEQIALAKGIDKATLASSAQTKAMIALEAIFQDTQKAQGDFARTSDQLANSTKILEAKWRDLQVRLGEKFIPIAEKLTGILIGLADASEDSRFLAFIERMQNIGETFAKLNPLVQAYLNWIDAVNDESQKGNEISEQWQKNMQAFATNMQEATSIGTQVADFDRNIVNSSANARTLSGIINKIPVGLQESQELSLNFGENLEQTALSGNFLWTTITGIASSLGSAVAQGRELSQVFEQLIKQLASRALVGLIGGALGTLLIPGVGFGAGFKFASGFQHGGSFIVPGQGTGDRPFMMNLAPGERVDVTPRNQVTNNNMGPVNISITTQTVDENFVRTKLAPIMQRLSRDGNVSFGMA